MKKIIRLSGLILLLCLFAIAPLSAQISAGGVPFSLRASWQNTLAQQKIEEAIVPEFDRVKARQEDEALLGTVRFAAPIQVDWQLENQGAWTILPNGDRIWRLKVYAKEALGIFVFYDDFYLPRGAQFYMYDEAGKQIKGAYTSRNNKASGKFMTGMIEGETAILEYYEPLTVRGQGVIDISKIYYAYENSYVPPTAAGEFSVYSGFGDALPCHTNINCPEGDDWQEHKRGMVRILRVFDEGMGWCSGSMINNTAEDEKPYILSAFHCIAGFTPQLDVWRFDFNYETTSCSDPTEEPSYVSMMGCHNRSGREESDFLLLELLENVPYSYGIRFNGWNRDATHLPDTSTLIHHPRGDLKKISQDYDPATIFSNGINWNNGVITPANHHYEVLLDLGTIESGSSGSSLLDEEGRIVGQLHGGNASCSTFQTFFGRLSLSWEEGTAMNSRLKEWLDPTNSGVLTLDAYEPPAPTTVTISGNIESRTGEAMPNVAITLTGDDSQEMMTDASGNYSFEVAAGGSYTVKPTKNTNPVNGVSGFDIVLITQHILVINEMTDPYQLIAADIDGGGTISAFDLVHMRQVILFLIGEFPNSDSWRFSAAEILLSNLVDDVSDQDFIGIKIGDVNGNASVD